MNVKLPSKTVGSESELILGIETATIHCSVGLVRGDVVLGHKSLTDRAVHSEKLIDLVDELIKPHTDFSGIDAIAISIGPGSYTGLRIGLATGKGLAFHRNLPLLPVPTLTILEAVAHREESASAVFFIKSHRDLVYYTAVQKGEPLVLRRRVAHAQIEAVAQQYSDYLLIGDNDFGGRFGDRLKVLFPAGDVAAQIAARFYAELLPLSRNDLEPDYHSNLEAKTWPQQ